MAGKDINVPGKCMPPEKGEPMADYIDRKKLLEDLERFAPEGRAALLIVGKQKTVDAVPVVHGQWVSEYEYDFMSCEDVRTGFSCDKCGLYYKKRSNYCPNCGAHMDLEVE